MHISSLPGKTGIGTLGVHAYNFVDFFSLPEYPIIENSFEKGGKTINLYKLNKIVFNNQTIQLPTMSYTRIQSYKAVSTEDIELCVISKF